MKIGIIGAGWYGCHLALALKRVGHDVMIYEKNARIFSQVSGSFGIRLHAGPHYPRSPATRKSCRRGYDQFQQTYPELLVEHEYSIYALGALDADQNPSKIELRQFINVCEESPVHQAIDPKAYGFESVISAYNVQEPSIVLGARLRNAFEKYLNAADIRIHCGYEVRCLETVGTNILLGNGSSSEQFDKVINATGYQDHLPCDKQFPFDMEIVYQPCLALLYKDKFPGRKPFSFIVMDGWFPCMLPYLYHETNLDHQNTADYVLTHGKWTIMGSYRTVAEANHTLQQLTRNWVEAYIKKPTEDEMLRFWPEFKNRFEFFDWTAEVLAKCKTRREFRSAVTYEKNNIIHIVPGKVSNIFDVEQEVKALLCQENLIEHNGYLFVKEGVLDTSNTEISEKPGRHEASTGNLQTYDELTQKNAALICQGGSWGALSGAGDVTSVWRRGKYK